ncbi:MAG TPA: polysaccharide deacetylase family protein [Chitinophagaceae bacterium]|nr:polysaccharide deacetylase family protein [Chitinophagaceae bacterium]
MKKFYQSIRPRPGLFLFFNSSLVIIAGCDADEKMKKATIPTAQMAIPTTPAPPPMMADGISVMNKTEVPILCYHQLRNFRSTDSKRARDYIVPVLNFREQIKSLADSGFHSILPDQLYDYLAYGKPLPAKPVMITFDDTRLEHYTEALIELNKYGFKGVFFIMTVSLNRPGYMSKEQVKQLADGGHVIGLHTWNHKNVKTFTNEDWLIQVEKPAAQLRQITGKPVDYFAYPFGLWDRSSLQQLKERFKAAFQLSARRDESLPLFCIRRIIVPGEWNASTMQKYMKTSFSVSGKTK